MECLVSNSEDLDSLEKAQSYEFEDGNGTKMTSYMIRFADYNLNLK